MAFTQDDLTAINDAIATGELEVQFADGKRVRYRSINELMRAKQHIQESLDAKGGKAPKRGVRLNVNKGV